MEKNKEKILISTLFLVAFSFLFFFVGIDAVYAATDPASVHSNYTMEATANGWGSLGLLWALLMGFNYLLYAVFSICALLVNLSAVVIGFAVDPIAFKALFDMDSVYLLWQMIRDFFNLFFILTLLFIAFATIFQIDSFNYKKTLGKLLLMAMLVNFSFPIARFIIDTANVPMYFFLENIFQDKTKAAGTQVVETALKTSKLKSIILPGYDANSSYEIHGSETQTKDLIIGIVFVFLLGVSLIVLGILLVIRVIALVILVIFSSVGFAGMVIPGFRQYATKWWDNMLKYAFFGPAAALMLLVSVRVMEGFTSDNSVTQQINKLSGANADPSTTLSLVSLTSVAIPLILIWMSISIGQTMGIAGAGMVTSRAQQFSKWAGRKASGYDYTARRVKAFGSEMKKRSDAKFAATNIGTRLGQKAGLKMDEMSAKRVGTRFESRGARHDASAAEESQKRQIAAEAANHRINDRTSQSELKKQADEAYAAKDRAWLMAVQNQQSKKPETAEDIKDEHKDFLNENYKDIGEVKNAARKENDDALAAHRADLVYRSETDREDALKKGKIKLDQQSSKSLNTLAAAAVKTGKVNQEMLETMKKEDPAKAASFITAVDAGIKAMEKEYARVESRGGTLTEEQQKARATSHQAYYHATGSMHGTVMGNNAHHAAVRGRVFKKANPTTLKANLKNPATRDADVENIVRSTPTGQIVSTTATLVDEDEAAARAFVANIRSQQTHSDPTIRANADSAMKMLANDRRTQHLI